LRLDHVIRIKQLFIVVENLLIVGFGLVQILACDPVHQISYPSQIKVLFRQGQIEHLMCRVSHFMIFKGELEIFKIVEKKLILGEVYLINLLQY
jgi:hypothetical protein